MSPTEIESDVSTTQTEPQGVASAGPIVFFDGVCGLCNTTVDWIVKRDRRGIFRFAPLQGETAAERLSKADTEQLSSLVLIMDGQTYRKSSAVARILWQLGAWHQVAGTLLWVIPRPMRDWGYTVVARNRYRWFGKKESCRLPTPEERGRFLP